MTRCAAWLAFLVFFALPLLSLPIPRALASDDASRDPWDMARRYLKNGDAEVASQIMHELAHTDTSVARRAAKVVRVIGVSDPAAFRRLLQHPDLGPSGWQAILAELEQMPETSERRRALIAIADELRTTRRLAN